VVCNYQAAVALFLHRLLAEGRDLLAHGAARVAEAEGLYARADFARDVGCFAELTARLGAVPFPGCQAEAWRTAMWDF